MAEILVENRVCEACGADVRPGALFCYNCGESVAPKDEERNNGKKENAGEIWFREDIGEDNGNQPDNQPEVVKIERNNAENIAENKESPVAAFAEKNVQTTTIDEPIKLKSAASLRRKSKVIPQKKIEIVWEENENAANGWFIFVAFVLVIFAIVLVYLAMYFR